MISIIIIITVFPPLQGSIIIAVFPCRWSKKESTRGLWSKKGRPEQEQKDASISQTSSRLSTEQSSITLELHHHRCLSAPSEQHHLVAASSLLSFHVGGARKKVDAYGARKEGRSKNSRIPQSHRHRRFAFCHCCST
jgi:hypothetical protein